MREAVIVAFDGERWHVEPEGVDQGYVDRMVPGTVLRVALTLNVAAGEQRWEATELDPFGPAPPPGLVAWLAGNTSPGIFLAERFFPPGAIERMHELRMARYRDGLSDAGLAAGLAEIARGGMAPASLGGLVVAIYALDPATAEGLLAELEERGS